MDGVDGQRAAAVDPEGLLRSALEKIVFFECRVSQLESEAQAARTTAERARGDAAQARRREVELEQALAVERGGRAEAENRAGELAERVRLLETERERLLAGLVDRARVAGAKASDGTPGPEEDGADLAGFIAELRSEIEELRTWKQAHEGASEPATARLRPAARAYARGERTEGGDDVQAVAARFASEGRVGLSGKDAEALRGQLATHADRALYERSMDDLSAADPGRRLRAVRALEALGAKAAAPLLAASLGREVEADVKAAILGALGRLGDPIAADLAARALEDARPAVRVAALEALAAVQKHGAEGRLSAALRDPSPLVRRRAALLLGFAHGGRAEEALAVALSDEDRGVARAAAAALSGRPTASAQAALVRGLDHADASVRKAVAAALGRLAGEAPLVEGPGAVRRAASRRIAEKLATMGADEIRSAVLDGAPSARAAEVTVRPPQPMGTVHPERRGREAAPETRGVRSAVAVAPATAPEPAGPPDDSTLSLLSELRGALRGRTEPELVEVLGQGPAKIAALTERLSTAGAIVRRGSRWFPA
ncbi:MAG: HEAT repeat domain-containing protein [Anaeromyxobacteraceae bacterium]